jgi:predicted O-methyltransferase YrrM
MDGRAEMPMASAGGKPFAGMVLSLAEILALALLARNTRAQCILEIGTAMGGTTRLLALNAPDAIVHTLDLPSDEAGTVLPGTDEEFRRKTATGADLETARERIVQHFGDSATFDFRSIGSEFGLAFIDGSHSYEYVRSDTERVLPLMAEGGVIVWHDFGGGVSLGYGVTEYLRRIQPVLNVRLIRGTSFGVARIEGKAKLMQRLSART